MSAGWPFPYRHKVGNGSVAKQKFEYLFNGISLGGCRLQTGGLWQSFATQAPPI